MKTLTADQKQILKEFITTFLPKRGNKRKNSGNEIDYIRSTLDRVFIQNLGFNISRHNIIDAFEELGYDIFTKKGEWNIDKKNFIPSTKGNSIRFGDVYSENDTMFVYVDVEAPILRLLMLSTFNTHPNISIKKLKLIDQMEKRLQLFKQTIISKVTDLKSPDSN